jgi:hypothetical protein
VGLIEQAIPNYFRRISDSILAVRAASESTNLQPGDLILSVNGEATGASLYRLRKLLQGPHNSADFLIIREHKVLTVKVPLEDTQAYEKRAQLDFVYLSGMIFHQTSQFMSYLTNPATSSQVVLGTTLETPESNFQSLEFPPPGSIVLGLYVGDVFYPVQNLRDLKKALNAHRDVKFIRLRVLPTRMMMTERGITPIYDQRYGVPIMDSHPRTYVVPVSEIITPLQFSVNQFAKNFGFSSTEFATRDWRKYVKPFPQNLCDSLLK